MCSWGCELNTIMNQGDACVDWGGKRVKKGAIKEMREFYYEAIRSFLSQEPCKGM